jgi:CRISPR/Cas system-associated exonuclease Cas4 (RecB family)
LGVVFCLTYEVNKRYDLKIRNNILSMQITKTDYLEYTFCKKNLWLKKHKPELFDGVELSDFEKKIIEEGNLADEEARHLFKGGVLVDSQGDWAVLDTKKYISKKTPVIFQATFLQNNFFIRADILVYNNIRNGFELYEVKASNDIKRVAPHNYINDLAFQKSVIELSGLSIIKTGVIHLNKDYKRQGKLDYNRLFVIADISDEVELAQDEVKKQMEDMKKYLGSEEEKGCECLYRGRSNHCTTFNYSNPDVPDYSVHDINRIGASKKLFYDWIDKRIFKIEDIPNPEKLKGIKKLQYDSVILGKPIINKIAIKEELSRLRFPLQFFDYEGFTGAIPMFDGFGAYEQIPFQYSLHIMQEDGSLEHREFLITEPKTDLTKPLIERMKKDINPKGTVIAWYITYESQRNKKLVELHPNDADFLNQINDNMFDLMSIFSNGYYLDPDFKGSSSIKKVLPVLVPELTYKNLNISKGDQASERWQKMISSETSAEEKEAIKRDLLQYCKLDTLAMVKIYQFLKNLVSNI